MFYRSYRYLQGVASPEAHGGERITRDLSQWGSPWAPWMHRTRCSWTSSWCNPAALSDWKRLGVCDIKLMFRSMSSGVDLRCGWCCVWEFKSWKEELGNFRMIIGWWLAELTFQLSISKFPSIDTNSRISHEWKIISFCISPPCIRKLNRSRKDSQKC